jgi:hypothetical protein
MARRRSHRRHPVHLAGLFVSAGALTVMLSLTTATQLWDTAKVMTASATVGASASVAPNEHNVLAQQLAEKERMLAEREAAVARNENERWAFGSADTLALSSVILSLVLLALVGINFYFDMRRGLPRVLTVDLRRT